MRCTALLLPRLLPQTLYTWRLALDSTRLVRAPPRSARARSTSRAALQLLPLRRLFPPRQNAPPFGSYAYELPRPRIYEHI